MAVCLKVLLSASDVWTTHVMPCSSVDAIGNGDMKTGEGGREDEQLFHLNFINLYTPHLEFSVL